MMRKWAKIALLAGATVIGVARRLFSHTERPVDASTSKERGNQNRGVDVKQLLWRTARYFAVFLVLMSLGGLLGAASGIIPIKASSGHWTITRWFLQFSKQRSVATHTLGMDAPALDEQRLVLKGAGTYEINCRPCHGNPSVPHPRVAQQMTPRPPYLPSTLSRWEADELFYMVKHGIKFTGMPAWPTQQRDDEVWAMVAFLRRFPGLNADDYSELVNTELLASGAALSIDQLDPKHVSRAIMTSCARCHGMDGIGRGLGAFPKLAGQQVAYLEASLQAFARGERHSGIMGPIAAGLSPDEITELARYYASLPKSTAPSAASDAVAAIERGRVIAEEGVSAKRVPACVACHGPSDVIRNPVYPKLAGQYADYLVLQLELFKKGHRGGTTYAQLMGTVAARLTAEQVSDVAFYYSSLTSTNDLPVP